MNQSTPFTIERTYNAPIDKVWKAITDINEMKKWYFPLTEFKPVVGFEFSFEKYIEERKKTFVHLFKVTEVIPGKKIAYTWRYEGFDGDSVVTWELFPEGDKTRLKLSHEGIETFPRIPDFAKKNFEEGWTYIIGKSLMNYLEN